LETRTDTKLIGGWPPCFAVQRGGGKWRGVQSQSEVTVVEIPSSPREKVWRVSWKHVIETIPSDACTNSFVLRHC